jgi:chaperone required for assembly of F1-ATPase
VSAWKPKRFWKSVSVAPVAGGFSVLLDARPARTPGKLPLVLPTEAMARAVAAEWEAQEGLLKPETMPFTRSANSALEKVAPQRAEVVAMLAAYGGSDLLCYRATGPEALAARQAQAWDPLLDWAAQDLQAPLKVTIGVMPVAQAPQALDRLHALVAEFSDFQIAAFHDLVALSGSLILAFATVRGRVSPDEAWAFSRIDETWQAELWGVDDEAASLTESKRQAFAHAVSFWAVSLPN